MSLEDITHYKWISETLASSGQPSELQFKTIAEAGFDVVVNLAMPNSDDAIPEEGYIVTARKMTYVHLPVPFEAPNADHLKTFIKLLEGFQNKRCWIHCVVNYRASAFLYQYYRLGLKIDAEIAKDVIFEDWEPDEIWQRFMSLDEKDVFD